jgi:hypothetical protein
MPDKGLIEKYLTLSRFVKGNVPSDTERTSPT